MRLLVEVPRQVDLPLMVGLVPGEEDDRFTDGAATGHLLCKVGWAKRSDVIAKRAIVWLERGADLAERRDPLVVRCAPAAVSRDELLVLRLTAAQVDVEVLVVRGGTVHGLPGDV